MDLISSVGNLNINSDDLAELWKHFRQNFEIYLTANELHDKPEDVKVAKFLNAAGPEAVKVYNTFSLSDVEKNNLGCVIEAFEKYCTTSRRNQIHDTYLFYKRRQTENETFYAFVDDLRRMIKFCGFEDEEDRMLRDRIVFGVLDRDLQKRYFACQQLDLNQTIEMGNAAEKERNRNLSESKGETVLMQPTDEWQIVQPRYKICAYCNLRHASHARCPAKGTICTYCNKPNHYTRACRERIIDGEKKLANLTAQRYIP